jgi:hypothetical protein
LYDEILSRYVKEKKTSEVVYVSEILSKLYADNGDFPAAEEYLREAIAVSLPRSLVQSNG